MDAFDRVAAEHGDRLLHAAYGLCGDWQHAEDLVHQALVATARRWERIADNPAGYAYRCLVRANIDRWRVWGGERVCAVGDGTDYPFEQCGLAAQQADAVAHDIAALAGAVVPPAAFAPVLRGRLVTGSGDRFLLHAEGD